MTLEIYVDVSVDPQRPPCLGMAAVLVCGDAVRSFTQTIGAFGRSTTLAEFLAVEYGLTRVRANRRSGIGIRVYSDNRRVVDALELGTAAPELEAAYHRVLRLLLQYRAWSVFWVRAHAGHPHNELADYLARNARENGCGVRV